MKSLPSWSERLLKAICPEELYEQIEGDLIEIYNYEVKTVGERKAKLRFALACFRFFRPGIFLRNKFSIDFTQMSMFQNYFKTTYRSLLKSKINFMFKLGGLTLALLSFLIIAIYVSFQLSFDRYHENYENIYRVNSEWRENGNMAKYAIAPTGIGPALKEEFPEVYSYARLRSPGQYLIKYEDKSFQFDGFSDADSSIFDVFTFQFIKGDRHALNHPGSIVLTQSLATQIFGDEDPLNKSISFTDRFNMSFEVTAVIEDMPHNSHLDIKALVPFNSLLDSMELAMDPWGINIDGSTCLYLRLNNDSKPEQFSSKAILLARNRITKREDGLEKEYAISLQPLKDIYLAQRIYAEFCAKGNGMYVYVFSLLGIFY